RSPDTRVTSASTSASAVVGDAGASEVMLTSTPSPILRVRAPNSLPVSARFGRDARNRSAPQWDTGRGDVAFQSSREPGHGYGDRTITAGDELRKITCA